MGDLCWISKLATMSRRPHSDTNTRNQHTSRNMGGYFSTEEQATVESYVIKENSFEIGSDWIGTINSLVDEHKKVADQISRLEKELSQLKDRYKHHDEIITTAERITCIIREQQKHQHNTGSQEISMRNKSDEEAQSEHENDHTTKAELSLEMDALKRGHRTFEVLLEDQEHQLAHLESEVKNHGDKIKEHEQSIKLLKEQHKQRKQNIKTQRVFILELQKDLKKYEKSITRIGTEYKRSKEISLKRSQTCKSSHPNDRQTTEQKNTGRARKISDLEKTKHVTHRIEAPPTAVQKKTRKYAFPFNKELTQAFQSMKSEKLGFFNSTADQNYFDEFVEILKEDIMEVSMHEYSPIGGISAFDRILVFGTCTLRVESDSNMALDKIPKEHRSKVVLVMFHKTAGSKTPEEVYMYSFKHAEVAKELHLPFKLNYKH